MFVHYLFFNLKGVGGGFCFTLPRPFINFSNAFLVFPLSPSTVAGAELRFAFGAVGLVVLVFAAANKSRIDDCLAFGDDLP